MPCFPCCQRRQRRVHTIQLTVAEAPNRAASEEDEATTEDGKATQSSTSQDKIIKEILESDTDVTLPGQVTTNEGRKATTQQGTKQCRTDPVVQANGESEAAGKASLGPLKHTRKVGAVECNQFLKYLEKNTKKESGEASGSGETGCGLPPINSPNDTLMKRKVKKLAKIKLPPILGQRLPTAEKRARAQENGETTRPDTTANPSEELYSKDEIEMMETIEQHYIKGLRV